MVQNSPKWSKWSKMVKNGEKWSKSPKMVQNGPKWSKIVQNGQKWWKWWKWSKWWKWVTRPERSKGAKDEVKQARRAQSRPVRGPSVVPSRGPSGVLVSCNFLCLVVFLKGIPRVNNRAAFLCPDISHICTHIYALSYMHSSDSPPYGRAITLGIIRLPDWDNPWEYWSIVCIMNKR